VLGGAFEAHKKGLYTLSIPAFLAQTDGMAFEILQAFIFTNHAGNTSANAKSLIDAEEHDHELMCSFVGIPLEEHGIRVSTRRRDQRKLSGDTVSPLNRHGVVRGIDLDYLTEANSLRARNARSPVVSKVGRFPALTPAQQDARIVSITLSTGRFVGLRLADASG
jgi:hypothetical protein